MSFSDLNLNVTLGAIFIGNVAASALFGITSLQAYYFFNDNTRDSKNFKCLIAFLWLLDLLHQIFMTHGVYHYLVSSSSNPSALASPTWSLLSQVIITCISDIIVRCVFARRIWLLSNRNTFLYIVIIIVSAFVFAMGFAFAVRGFLTMTFAAIIVESWLLYSALGGSVVADGLVTSSLCVLLVHNRTGIKKTDSLVNSLMLYTINTGLLTSVCATASFVTFAIWPHEFIFMGIYFALSKLYVNSLLAVLNSREKLRRRNSGLTSLPMSPTSVGRLTIMTQNSAAESTGLDSPDMNMPQPLKHSWMAR